MERERGAKGVHEVSKGTQGFIQDFLVGKEVCGALPQCMHEYETVQIFKLAWTIQIFKFSGGGREKFRDPTLSMKPWYMYILES